MRVKSPLPPLKGEASEDFDPSKPNVFIPCSISNPEGKFAIAVKKASKYKLVYDDSANGHDAGLASIDPRDAITLPRVVPPLPVQVDRRQNPKTEDDRGSKDGGEDVQRQPGKQKSVLADAFAIKDEPGVG